MPRSSTERLGAIQLPDPAPHLNDQLRRRSLRLHRSSGQQAQCRRQTDAALITHLDLDCIFHVPCTLPDLLPRDRRPIIPVLRHSTDPRATADVGASLISMAGPLPFDALVPPPWTFSGNLYASLRQTCQLRHKTTLDELCMSRRTDTLSEMSLQVGHAWFHNREQYHCVTAEGQLDWPCRHYWSHCPDAAHLRAQVALQLGRSI